MDTAAPRFLVRCPSVLCINSAVERIDWPRRCRGWSRRRRGWWCWEWRRWHCHRGLWQSCSLATTAHGHTAIVFLRLGPRGLYHRCASEPSLAIERQRRRRTRQQPAEQRDKQQEAKKADEAREVSPRPHHVEVSSVAHILVCRLLHILALAIAHIRQGATACTPTTCDATCGALLSRPDPTSNPIATSATRRTRESTCRSCNYPTMATGCGREASSTHSASTIRAVHGAA